MSRNYQNSPEFQRDDAAICRRLDRLAEERARETGRKPLMDEWQARQINEFLRRNPDARDAVERKIMTISSPCGTPITARTRVCRHLTRLDLQDCMACADEAELADRLPTSTLTARLRAGMKP